MSSHPTAAFGGMPDDPVLPWPASVRVAFAEWQWLRPLSAILQHTRWTIDDVVSTPRAAAEVRLFWKVLQAGRRMSRERQASLRRDEERWMRRLGCPIPCPDCGTTGACGCG